MYNNRKRVQETGSSLFTCGEWLLRDVSDRCSPGYAARPCRLSGDPIGPEAIRGSERSCLQLVCKETRRLPRPPGLSASGISYLIIVVGLNRFGKFWNSVGPSGSESVKAVFDFAVRNGGTALFRHGRLISIPNDNTDTQQPFADRSATPPVRRKREVRLQGTADCTSVQNQTAD